MEIAIIFLVNVFSSFLKRWIYPKYGGTGIQVTVFVLALIGATYLSFRDKVAGLREIVEGALAIFVVAISFYEVILSKLSWFKDGK